MAEPYVALAVPSAFAEAAFLTYMALQRAPVSRSAPGSDGSGLLAGRFVFTRLGQSQAPPLPLAASIAGAASLSVTCDEAQGSLMLRMGLCDFVVRTLDESLRILKNEIRKKQPVSVCVTDDFSSVAGEMAERGVAPDILVELPGAPLGNIARSGKGALLDLAGPPEGLPDEIVRWSGPGLLRVDEAAISILPQADRLRRRWISASPRYLPRMRPLKHVCSMERGEAAEFVNVLSGRVMAGEINGPICVEAYGESSVLGEQA